MKKSRYLESVLHVLQASGRLGEHVGILLRVPPFLNTPLMLKALDDPVAGGDDPV